jgi:NTE family protein
MKQYTLILLLLLSSFGFAQTKNQDDLKVGLVLSGGGLKGWLI